tara:strand:+ start:40 stop:204 length:165 start_codon:yes stop_codon:yes gene_type:complete
MGEVRDVGDVDVEVLRDLVEKIESVYYGEEVLVEDFVRALVVVLLRVDPNGEYS